MPSLFQCEGKEVWWCTSVSPACGRNIKRNVCRWLNHICCSSVCSPISGAIIRDQVAEWQSKMITLYSLNWDAKEGQCVLAISSPAWPKKQQWSLVRMFALLSLLSKTLLHRFQSFEGQKGPLYHAVTSPGWDCPGNRWLTHKWSSLGEKKICFIIIFQGKKKRKATQTQEILKLHIELYQQGKMKTHHCSIFL